MNESIDEMSEAYPYRQYGDGEGMGRTRSGSFGPAAEMAARARDAQAVIHTPGGERFPVEQYPWLPKAALPAVPRVLKPFPASATSVWKRLVESWRTYGRTLPVDSAFRKEFPIESGVNRYFPAAIVCCAAWSKFNNQKHNPGEPLHHSRAKSGDHEECIARHNLDIADAQRRDAGDDLTELEEATAVFWRAGARLQILAERLGAPPAPAARFPEETQK